MSEALSTPAPIEKDMDPSLLALILQDPQASIHPGDRIVTRHAATGREVTHVVTRIDPDHAIVARSQHGAMIGTVIVAGEWEVVSIKPQATAR